MRTAGRGRRWRSRVAVADLYWRDAAACREYDPEAFYPANVNNESQVSEARRVCRRCEVIESCFWDVMDAEGSSSVSYRHGVWAGLIPRERVKLSKKIRAEREGSGSP